MKTRPNPFALIVLMSLLLAAPAAWAADPAVLSQIPADAELVVVTQPLNIVSAKLDLFARVVGIPLPENQPFKIEDALADLIGIPGVIDGSQSFAFAIVDLKKTESTMLGFLPVADAQAVLQEQAAQKVADMPGVWQLPGEDVFLKPAGKYLVIAQQGQALLGLDTKPKGFKLTPADSQLLAQSEALALIKLGPVIPELQEQILQEMASNDDIQKHPGLKKVITMALDRLAELEKVTLAASVGKGGIKLTINSLARPDSTLAKYLTNHPTTNIAPLAKLPASNFVTAAAYRLDSKAFQEPVFAVLDALAQEITQDDQDVSAQMKQVKDLISHMYELSLSDAVSQALYVSQTPPSASPGLRALEVTSFKNAQETLADAQKLLPLLSSLIEKAGYKLPMHYRAAVGKVDGLNYDEISLDLSQLPLPEEALMALAQQWGGQAAITEQVCLLDSERLAVAMGQASLQEIVNLAKTKPAGLDQDPGIAHAAANLSSPANALAFINVGNYLQMMMSQMMTVGPQGGINPMMMFMPLLEQIKGTVGISATMNIGSVAAEVFIPAELIAGGYKAYMQMMMQMTQPPQVEPPSEPNQSESTL